MWRSYFLSDLKGSHVQLLRYLYTDRHCALSDGPLMPVLEQIISFSTRNCWNIVLTLDDVNSAVTTPDECSIKIAWQVVPVSSNVSREAGIHDFAGKLPVLTSLQLSTRNFQIIGCVRPVCRMRYYSLCPVILLFQLWHGVFDARRSRISLP